MSSHSPWRNRLLRRDASCVLQARLFSRRACGACVPEAAGLVSPKLKTRGISTHPGGGGYGAPSHVGGQPHGPRLSSARHLHLANGPEVGRRGAARRRARRAQVVGVARRGARPVRRLRPGRDRRQARPDPRRGGLRHGQADAAVAPDRAPRRPGARWRRSRGDLRDHRHLARSVHPPGHLRSRDAHSRLSRVQSVHRRIQPDPARSLLRARVSPQPRRDARGGRVAPLRHPKLRLVLGESGIGWLPYILERLDDTYEERLADDLKLPLPPSAYFKRQMYATFQKDFHGVRAMAEIAPDNVMWGSDYPHRDGTWPFSQKAIEEQFRGIDPKIQRKMLWENVRRVYRIDE